MASAQPLLEADAPAPPAFPAAHDAARKDEVSILKALTTTMCQQEFHGMLPLHFAAGFNALRCMDHLLSLQPGVPESVNVTDNAGRTPLMHAVSNRSEESVVWLTARSKKLDAVDAEGMAAVHHAVNLGSASLTALLANLGFDMEQTSSEGTPLELAVKHGDLKIVEYLVLTHGCSEATISKAQTVMPTGASAFWITRCLQKRVGCHEKAADEGKLCGPISGGCDLPWKARCVGGGLEELHSYGRQASLLTAALCVGVSIAFLSLPRDEQLQASEFLHHCLAYVAICCTLIGTPLFYRASRKALDDPCPARCQRYLAALQRVQQVTSTDCARSEKPGFSWWGEVEPVIHQMKMVGPPRSKYCWSSRRVVPVFDHYCMFLRNSVGHHNYAAFWGTVVSATIACSCLVFIAFSLLRSGQCTFPCFVVVWWFGCFAIAGYTLLAMHLSIMRNGFTSNEYIQLQRGRAPAYLCDPTQEDVILNPYNKGFLKNFMARVCSGPPDSAAVASPDAAV